MVTTVESKDVHRMLKAAGRQMPFAASLALNNTAKAMAAKLSEEMPRYIDRPTPFTRKAFAIKRSHKRTRPIRAEVFIKTIQAAYLGYLIEGGVRTPTRRALPVPVQAKLNKYGNIPRGSITRRLARPDTFSYTIKGVAGVWQKYGRKKRKIRLLIAWETRTTYTPGFPFLRIGRKEFSKRWRPELRAALKHAIRTAR